MGKILEEHDAAFRVNGFIAIYQEKGVYYIPLADWDDLNRILDGKSDWYHGVTIEGNDIRVKVTSITDIMRIGSERATILEEDRITEEVRG